MSLDPQAPVSSLGEDGVVALLRERFAAPEGVLGIGDDTAVFPAPGASLLMTTDTLVQDVDFALAYFSGGDLGWKAMAVNVSDLAAMGAEPSYAVATLCLPAETTIGFVLDLVAGLGDAGRAWDVTLVGGDLSRDDRISLGVTLLGHGDNPVLRSGAQIGDAILVSGELGGSAGGLRLLQANPNAAGPLVDRHRRPQPRLELSRALRDVGVTSMIDISDGLIVDLRRLMEASAVGCRVEPALVPVDPGVTVDNELDPISAALFGGEDFELLFTVAVGKVNEATDAGGRIGTAVTRIGTVTGGDRFLGHVTFDDLEDKGWDHLRNR